MKRTASIGMFFAAVAAALVHANANASETCPEPIDPPCVPSINKRCNVNMPLDLIDGAADTDYYYRFNGAGVTIYIVDSGFVDAANPDAQAEFGNRYTNSDFITPGTWVNTPNNHGYNMAVAAAGAIKGVASGANIRQVRVNVDGADSDNSSLKAALTWLKTAPLQQKSVISISQARAYDESVNDLIEEVVTRGFPVFVSAGNNNSNVSGYSPASAEAAFTVSAGDCSEGRANWANYGSRVDGFVYAPNTLTGGTSQATALAAGVAALIWQENPTFTGDNVVAKMIERAETGVMPPLTLQGSPNKIITSVPIPQSPSFFGIRNKLCGGLNTLQWLDSGPEILRYELQSSVNSQFTSSVLEYSGLNQAYTVNVGSTTYYRVRACTTRCGTWKNANQPATFTPDMSGCQ